MKNINDGQMVEPDIDLFIMTHKGFAPPVKNPAYKVLHGNNEIDECGQLICYKCVGDGKLDDKFYSELYMLMNLPDIQRKKYIGLCHYRRYFNFLDNLPDFDKLFENFDCIAAMPMTMKVPIRVQYGLYHNIEDYDIVGEIIKQHHPGYYETFINVSDGRLFFPYNMFIMKRDDFDEYIKFVSGVLDKYIGIVGDDITKRILDNSEKYLNKEYEQNKTVEYQYRIGGYLGERLTNIFIRDRFKNIGFCDIVVTEQKYGQEMVKINDLSKKARVN